MKFAIIGLGRMGFNLALQALEDGFDVVAYNRSKEKTDELVNHLPAIGYRRRQVQAGELGMRNNESGKLTPANTIEDVIKDLPVPRIILLMLPAGEVVDGMIENLLSAGLSKGDSIIDGGNSFYKDSIRRYNSLKEKGIHFLDMGTSGGIEGARNGACLTIGGDKEVFEKLEPLFKALAIENGYGYVGPAGAGHFVKVTHNGIEYGMLQAIGEGFAVLEKGPYQLDFAQIARIWSHGSVIRGWLMELAQKAFEKDPKLDHLEGIVGGGETGRWTVETAKEEGVEVPVLEASLKAREDSQKRSSFSGKVIAALRNQFGQHEVKKS